MQDVFCNQVLSSVKSVVDEVKVGVGPDIEGRVAEDDDFWDYELIGMMKKQEERVAFLDNNLMEMITNCDDKVDAGKS